VKLKTEVPKCAENVVQRLIAHCIGGELRSSLLLTIKSCFRFSVYDFSHARIRERQEPSWIHSPRPIHPSPMGFPKGHYAIPAISELATNARFSSHAPRRVSTYITPIARRK
jgi:hypothetical protein